MPKISKTLKFKCEYCSRTFQQFLKLSEHTNNCEFGKRINMQNTSEGRLAHKLWSLSFKNTSRKKYDYNVFIAHRDFKFFINLATFCYKVNALNSEKYMDWCIKEKIKLKLWTSEFNYEKFVKHYLTHEDPIDAVLRSIEFIRNDCVIGNYFGGVHPGTFLSNIDTGRVSPWLYLLYPKSNDILYRMNEDQKNYLNKIIDHSIWSMLQRRHKTVCDEIKKTLKKEII